MREVHRLSHALLVDFGSVKKTLDFCPDIFFHLCSLPSEGLIRDSIISIFFSFVNMYYYASVYEEKKKLIITRSTGGNFRRN